MDMGYKIFHNSAITLTEGHHHWKNGVQLAKSEINLGVIGGTQQVASFERSNLGINLTSAWDMVRLWIVRQ